MSGGWRRSSKFSIQADEYEPLNPEETVFIKKVFALMERRGPRGDVVLKRRHRVDDEKLPHHYCFGLYTYCDSPPMAKQLLTRKQDNPSRSRS